MRIAAIVALFFASVLAAANAAPACDPIPGVEKLWAKPSTHFILFGEMHGTAESPKLFGEAICSALAKGRTIVAGFEFPQSERPAIEAYLTSKGTAADREALLRNGHWRGLPDGRGSEAMFNVVERLRRLRADGARLSLIAFVPDLAPHSTPAQYEADMAAVLAQAPRRSLVMALMGNIHARMSGDFGGGRTLGYQPMAAHLPPDQVVAVDMTAIHGGTAWNCSMPTGKADLDCSAHGLGPGPMQPGITLLADTKSGYHATLGFDHATAAPSAVAPGTAK